MKRKNTLKQKKTLEDYVIDTVAYTMLIGIFVVTFYPMWYVIVASFSTGSYLAQVKGLLLWPGEFTLKAYEMVINDPRIWQGLKNSLLVLGLSLPINIALTAMCGYFLASTGMRLKKPIAAMIMFTMFFSGGMIPQYLNVKDLGLYDRVWALVLPGALSVYNAIICKTAIEGLPASLQESAYLDGANDLQILFKIVLPLIKPTLAVILLYYGVAHWNSWFNASIYLASESKVPVQNIIRAILLANTQFGDQGGVDSYDEYAEAIRYAAIVVSTFPILCVYPFLQKHFTKGVMIGAVKG